jgi:rod shape-determining protein MreC
VSFRDNPLGEIKVPLTWTAGVAVIVAIVVAITLLATDRRGVIQAEAYGATRKAADAVATPVGGVLSTPVRWVGDGVDTVRSYFFAISENRRLKAELEEAHEWRDAALALRNTNERYRVLLGLKTDPPIPMVSARIVTDARGPFANTRLANAGSEMGVKTGYPVMSENGLVGRVIGVTTGASRVLLLTDVASRTPVMIDRTNARAILTGDSGPNPRLDYLRGQNPVRSGDRVVTSGDGGVLPRGLPVGVAAKGLDGRWRVVLSSDAAPVDFVRILKFEDFSQLVDLKRLDEISVPPPSMPVNASVGVTAGAGVPKPAPAPAAGLAAAPKPTAAPAASASVSSVAPKAAGAVAQKLAGAAPAPAASKTAPGATSKPPVASAKPASPPITPAAPKSATGAAAKPAATAAKPNGTPTTASAASKAASKPSAEPAKATEATKASAAPKAASEPATKSKAPPAKPATAPATSKATTSATSKPAAKPAASSTNATAPAAKPASAPAAKVGSTPPSKSATTAAKATPQPVPTDRTSAPPSAKTATPAKKKTEEPPQ